LFSANWNTQDDAVYSIRNPKQGESAIFGLFCRVAWHLGQVFYGAFFFAIGWSIRLASRIGSQTLRKNMWN
jgi:hypothetical protein